MYAAATPVTLGTAGSAQVRQRRATRILAQASAIQTETAQLTAQAISAAANRVTTGQARSVSLDLPAVQNHLEKSAPVRQAAITHHHQ